MKATITRSLLLIVLLCGCVGATIVGGPPDGGAMDASAFDAPCTAEQRACSGRCADLRVDPAHCGACDTVCSAGQTCVLGRCELRCPNEDAVCQGRCVNLRTDAANCGACGRACGAGQVCSLGRCAMTCEAPLATCATAGAPTAACADLRTSPQHCGACGVACGDGQACLGGACELTCPAAQRACRGACRDLQSDDANCGACGNACPPGNTCALGACAPRCGEGLSLCGAACVNLQTDGAHCGACGAACGAGQVCSRGACGARCDAPATTCGEDGARACADLSIDPANCGGCGSACALANVATGGCAAGACTVVRCAAGSGDCDGNAANGCETSTLNSAANCGACGRACVLANASASCASGACAITGCAAGFLDCDGNAANGCEVDARTDNANCGGCGVTCPSGRVCAGGACGATCQATQVNCMGACATLASDPRHCGACGRSCPTPTNAAAAYCAASACGFVCGAGFGNCDNNAGNGCETDTRGSTSHCGACGRACGSGQSCVGGSCACPSGQRAVGTLCVAPGVTPRPLAPLSLGDVTQRRPTLRWALPSGYDGTRVELCRDRACMNVIETLTVAGRSVRPSTDLPARSVVFWRLRGLVGSAVDSVYSPTWLFHVPARSAPSGVDTSANPRLDMNGDGLDDVAIGAPYANPSGRWQVGTVSVSYGSTTWTPSAPGAPHAVDRRYEGFEGSRRFGASVASAGDVNGDGYGDLLVGHDYASLAGVSSGAAYVFYGGPVWSQPAAGTPSVPDRRVEGAAEGDRFGYSVGGAGDVNGDGYADLVVGSLLASPGGRTWAGSASVFYGSGAWVQPPEGGARTPDRRMEGVFAHDRFGGAVAGAGDVNGDGYSDVIAGSNQSAPGGRQNAGSASVFYGSATWTQPPEGSARTPNRLYEGPAPAYGFGYSVAGPGDVNGDGFADIIVGANYDRPGMRVQCGSASVFYGGASWTPGTLGVPSVADRLFEGIAQYDNLGFSVAR